ncbi:hypothetical protein F5146DRAFT_202670 [Armillaria mellea]|nr:hypothetical protein F5146DRAFT_202670 [Armillaria mellea]
MNTVSPHSIASVTAVATAVTTTFVADRRNSHHPPTALSRPERELPTIAACLDITMFIVLAFLALKIRQLRARAPRWGSARDDRDGLLGTPSDEKENEAKKKALLSDVAGPVLARETRADDVVSMDDTALVVEGTSVEERN